MRVDRTLFRPMAALTLGLSIASYSPAQDHEVPGGIRLLPGYEHRAGRGIDTQVGTIVNKTGVTITYDIGELAGNHAEKAKKTGKYRWYREQTWRNSLFQLVLTEDRTLYVYVPAAQANFYGRVPRDEDLVDALLIITTYTPQR